MSSETSTEPTVGGAADADALQPWQLFTLAGLIGATLTVFMSRGQSPSAVILLSLTIFAAALERLGYDVRRHLGRVGDPAAGTQQGRTHMEARWTVEPQATAPAHKPHAA